MRLLKRTMEFLFSASLGALCFGACGAYPIGTWNGKIWSFSVKQQAFMRTQDNQSVAATNSIAGNMLCMVKDDLNSFISTYVAPPVKSPKDQ